MTVVVMIVLVISLVKMSETVYVIRYIYRRSTAMGMKYFLNRQTRRMAMINENNTILSISIVIRSLTRSQQFS